VKIPCLFPRLSLKTAFSLSILVVCALSRKKFFKEMEQFQAFQGKKIDVIKNETL